MQSERSREQAWGFAGNWFSCLFPVLGIEKNMAVLNVNIQGSRQNKAKIEQNEPVYMTHFRATSFTKIVNYLMFLRFCYLPLMNRNLVEPLERWLKFLQPSMLNPTVVLPISGLIVFYFTTTSSVPTLFDFCFFNIFHGIFLHNLTGTTC